MKSTTRVLSVLTITGVTALSVFPMAAAPASAVTSSSAAASSSALTVKQVSTLAQYNAANGEYPENIVAAPDGSITVSWLGSRTGYGRSGLVRIAPDGSQTVLAILPDGSKVGGLARAADGTLYFNNKSENADLAGFWKLSPGGTPERIAALPTNATPNGLAIDESTGRLYATDFALGLIWGASLTDGAPATVWYEDSRLLPPTPGSYGANGLKLQNGELWISTTSAGVLYRLPISPLGTPGEMVAAVTGLNGIDDFSFIGNTGVIAAANNAGSRVDLIYPDGTTKTILSSADGLDGTTSTAVIGNKLYANNFGTSTGQPSTVVATLNLKAL